MRPQVSVERGPFEMVPHWILDEDISAQAIRLYMLLRRHGDRSGRCFPSRRRLAEQMHTSPSTVDRARTELVEVGAICERYRSGPEGDYTSNEYHVHWSQVTDCHTAGDDGCPACDEGCPACDETPPAYDETGVPPVVNELIPTRNLDPITQTNTTRTRVRKPVDDDPEFTEFWSAYPRKASKGSARRAWSKARQVTDAQTLIAAAQRYRDDPNRDDAYTAHAATWLNGERWLDGPLPERSTRSQARTSDVMDVIARAAARDRGEIEA